MKYLKIFMSCILLLGGSFAEDYPDTYTSGTVVFTPDERYKSSAEVLYMNSNNNKDYANIQVALDGRAFVFNKYTYKIMVFGADGSYETSWDVELPVSNSIYQDIHDMDMLDEKYLVLSGNHILLVYELNGELVHRIKKDYGIQQTVSLKNGRVAVESYTIDLNGKPPKRIMYIRIIDIQDESDTQVTFFEEELFKEMIAIRDDGFYRGYNRSIRRPDVHLARTADGNLIVGYSAYPNLSIYSADAELITDIQLKYPPPLTSDDELAELREGYIESARKHIENKSALDSMIAVIQSDDFFFNRTPNYYDVMTDSEGNILVFKHKKSEENHVVTVYHLYSGSGKFVSETVLLFEQFKRPDLRRITFGTDYLYGLFENNEDEGIGLYRGTFQNK
jgi:hypothetical protein